MVHRHSSHREILSALGLHKVVSEALGEKYPTVQGWYVRNDIPSRVWPRLISYAHSCGHVEITATLLTETMKEKQGFRAKRIGAEAHQ